MYMKMYFETWKCVSEIKYQKYQQNIEGNSSFRMWKWEKKSKLARIIYIFLNVSVLSDTVVYSAIPYEKIKAYNYVLRRSLASLARAYKLHVYYFFMSVHLGACPPPPLIYQKAGYAILLPAFAHQKSGQMKMADSVPPTRYTKSPPLVGMITFMQIWCLFRNWTSWLF